MNQLKETSKKTETVKIRLTAGEKELLKAIAKNQNKTMSQLIRIWMMEDWVNQFERVK